MSQGGHELDALALPMLQAAWMDPVWLGSPAPWAGHIPFAAWLIAATRPRTLVELGVYSGISYLSFCEAAVRHGVPLRAWGVDTWEGDHQAGYYGGEVLRTLRAQHDARYAGFSTLLQKAFDAAVDDIPDDSVDVLHIDGLHTYEAVRHDFETWRPKLSERAVVLFHDIEVQRGDFGVWRYWAELTRQHPSISFAHSSGLGVLLAGRDTPQVLRDLSADVQRQRAAQRCFKVLGERFELRAQALHQASLMQDWQARMQRDAAALETQNDWIRQQDQKLLEAERRQAHVAALLDDLRKTSAEREARSAEQYRDWYNRVTQAMREARLLHQQIDNMLASRSWRLTSGLRKLGTLARQARHSPVGTGTVVTLRRARNALRYAMVGDWRELLQRVQRLKLQATEAQQMEQFRGRVIACGILCTPHTLYVAHALQVALARANVHAAVVAEAEDYPLNLYFVVCPQMFKSLPPGEKRIAFQMEQTVSSRWLTPDYLALLENSLAVLDYAQTNLANLTELGIVYPHVYLVPIGGVDGYRAWLREEDAADQDCDVLFYGDANSPRRKRLLAEIGRHYTVRVVGNAFGADMRRALAGAKVVINIHYYEGALLETTRIFECLSLGKSIVSERATDQAEHRLLEAAVRFVDVDDAQGLVAAIGQALAEQNDEASRLRQRAHCEAAVRASQARFEYMLYRLLLSRRVLSYAQFAQLTGGSHLAPRLALSLPETVERRQAFEATRPADVQVFEGLRYSPGWIGCAMSYKYMAQVALQQGLTVLEIMEDDVVLPPDYEERRAAVKAYLDDHVGQWDVFVGLMAEVHPDTQILKVEQVGSNTFVTLDRMISAVCNIYSTKALQLIAQWDETDTNVQTNTIDRFIQRQTKLHAVVVLPFLVEHHQELNSSLWGISNMRYAQMITAAQAQLWRMVEQARTAQNGLP